MDVDEDQLRATAAKTTQALRAAGVRFALGGGCAVYAHGGPASEHDVDIFLTEDDVVPGGTRSWRRGCARRKRRTTGSPRPTTGRASSI